MELPFRLFPNKKRLATEKAISLFASKRPMIQFTKEDNFFTLQRDGGWKVPYALGRYEPWMPSLGIIGIREVQGRKWIASPAPFSQFKDSSGTPFASQEAALTAFFVIV